MLYVERSGIVDNEYEYDYSIFGSIYPLPLDEGDSKTKEQLLLIATIHFARNGYAAASMRDIAKIAGIRPSSIYHHFASKEELWKTVIEHTIRLYTLYFEHLEREIARAETFEEVLELIFQEPKKMRNTFSCYAFSMIQAEQFRDRDAERFFCGSLLDYGIEALRMWFDRCVERGMVEKFDTRTVASVIMNSVLIAVEVSVHRLNRAHALVALEDPRTMLGNLQRFILQAVAPLSAAPPESASYAECDAGNA